MIWLARISATMTVPNVASLFSLISHNPSYSSVKNSIAREGEVLDFCVPVNMHFPPPALKQRIVENLGEILRYYPDYLEVHQRHIAELTGLDATTIVPANGSTEIITMLCLERQGPVLTSVPTFGRWTDLPRELGVPLHTIQRRREHQFQLTPDEVIRRVRDVKARTLVISNPNNPTGAALSLDAIVAIASELTELETIIIDESFIDFSQLESASQYAAASKNLIVVKSMGKALGWHGVRLGYAVAEPRRARALRARLPYWNINGLAAFVLKSLTSLRAELVESFVKVAADRAYMARRLAEIPELIVYPSSANFLFVELPDGVSGRALRDCLLSHHGVMVRETSNKLGSSEQYFRLAVQREEAVDVLIAALQTELSSRIHRGGRN